jgi:AcrR family transcriptional regulator
MFTFIDMTAQKTPSPRVARKRKAKIELILDTAMAIAGKEGITGLTVHRLADRLDLTVGALYRYFPSKDAILTALQIRAVQNYGDRLRMAWRDAKEVAKGSQGASLVPIIALAYEYRHLVRTHVTEFHLTNQVLAAPEEQLAEEYASDVINPLLILCADLAQTAVLAQLSGALTEGNAIHRILIFWMAMMGIFQLAKIERHNPIIKIDDLFETMIRTQLVGWGADPSDIDAAFETTEEWATQRQE